MADHSQQLKRIMDESFFVRTTLLRKNGLPRTIETTYYWDGDREIVLSGYPGKRDWVASIARNSEVTVHTVEFEPGFNIKGTARVVRKRDERMPYLLKFIDRWTLRPGFPRRRFKFLLGAVRANRRLHLPWWGPFYFARKIFDGMPCVVITLSGEPVLRQGEMPELSEPQEGRPV